MVQWGQREGDVDRTGEAGRSSFSRRMMPPSRDPGLVGVLLLLLPEEDFVLVSCSLVTEGSLLEAAEGKEEEGRLSPSSSRSKSVCPLEGGRGGKEEEELEEAGVGEVGREAVLVGAGEVAAGVLICLKTGGGGGLGAALFFLGVGANAILEIPPPVHTLRGRC